MVDAFPVDVQVDRKVEVEQVVSERDAELLVTTVGLFVLLAEGKFWEHSPCQPRSPHRPLSSSDPPALHRTFLVRSPHMR